MNFVHLKRHRSILSVSCVFDATINNMQENLCNLQKIIEGEY